MKNQVPATTHKPIRKRILAACMAAMAMSTPLLTAQIKVTFDGDGDETTPTGTITVNLGDNSAVLSNLGGTMGIGAPSVSGGLAGLSGSFDISFEALGTVAQNFNPIDFTGGAADGVFTTGTEWAGNSDLSSNANNNPGQGIVFSFDFTNLVGSTGIDLTAVRWQSTANSSRLSFLDQGAGTSVLLSPSDNATPSDGGSGNQTVSFDPSQSLETDDQVAFWTDGSGQKRLKEFTFNFVPDGVTPPVNLVGTTDGAKVDLDWSDDQSGDLASYSVYRSETQGGPYGAAIATGVLTSDYSDDTVVTGTTYFYVVTATDGVIETGFSSEFEITPLIQAPTNVTAIPNNMVVDLDWDDNVSGILATYSVYRSLDPGGPFDTPLVADLTSSDYSDTDVTNGDPYYYVVTAIDNLTANESVDSAEVSATPFTPVLGSVLYTHLDASVEESVVLDEFGEVAEKVIIWEDLTGNFNDASASNGTVLYPSATLSQEGLQGLDMGSGRNNLRAFSSAGQNDWLDFTDGNAAQPYTGFAIFAAVTVDSILGGINRDIVLSSIESYFRLGYEAGRPQFWLGDGNERFRLENSTTPIVQAGDTLILAVNYDVATGTLELWDSVTGKTSSATVPVRDFSDNGDMLLGGSRNGDQYMDGMIGEVKIYRGAMTPTEFEDERNTLNFKWAGLTAPVGLVANPGNTEVTLDWADQIADSYEISRNGELLVEGLLTSNYTDTNLTNGVTYEYTVTAIKDGDFSNESDAVSATPFDPVATLYYHLDATDAGSVSVVNTNEVTEWADLTGNADFPAVASVGTMLYPSSSLSPTNLAGLDAGFDTGMGVTKTTLVTFNAAEQDSWLDFTSPSGAQPYTGFTVFAVVKADSILGANQRDIVLSSTEASFRLGYEGGSPQFWLNEGRLENSPDTQVIFPGDTVVLAVNYNAGTGSVELWDSVTRSTSMTTVAAANFSNNASLFLGGSTNPDQYMDGMIGELKIYRGVMTPSEFAAEQTALVTKWIGAPVGGFIGWQTANSTSQGIDGDHDLDGVENGVEFFLGGTNNTTGFTPVPGLVDNAGILSVTWTGAPTYTGTYGTDFVVETSTTLDGDWSPVTEGDGVSIEGGEVTYTFPSPLSGTLFVRLSVTGP